MRFRQALRRPIVFAITFMGLCVSAVAQPLSDAELRRLSDAVEKYVVQLKVSGYLDQKEKVAELGTGVIFRVTGGARVMTAGHVAGLETAFDSDPAYEGLRKRDVHIRQKSEFGTARLEPVHQARVNIEMDVAQVFIDGDAKEAPWLSSKRPERYETVVVVTWFEGLDRPKAYTVRVEPSQAQDGALIRLSSGFPRSASGSPVFNRKGDIVAILVRTANAGGVETSLASPIAEMQGWLSADLLRAGESTGTTEIRADPVPAETTATKRSGMVPSAAGKQFSDPYTLCSDPIPHGSRILKKEFFLTGDRSCGAWAECRETVSDSQRVCYEFRLQGHDELWFQNNGVRSSEGVLRVTYGPS